jgi:aminoglycoside phosphotransferase family enzyme/predicted kinase
MENSQSGTIAFLSRPETYGLTHGTVERHQTHGSIVFLAGDRAYKLKRAVQFSYMDYATVARRRAMCEAELAVNRRLAPELYLAVASVLDRDGQLRIGQPGEDEGAIDWLVVMRRFGQEALLESQRSSGMLNESAMRTLGTRIAAFHHAAERNYDLGGSRGIASVLDENAAALASLSGKPFAAEKVVQLIALSRGALEAQRALLDRRRQEGCVRRCHGDLHLNNICMIDGVPVPFDAIEFNDAFACIDVLYDLAFLLMDLDRHGLRGHANLVFNRYLEETGDVSGLGALPLFLSCRAALRAHVTVSMADAAPDARDRLLADAQSLLDCALGYLAPQTPRLVAIGGMSGTGKSTLAHALAPRLGRAPGAVVIRSDVLRKRVWGVDETTHLPPEAYSDAITARVYDDAMARARVVLEGGHSVIVDAVFGDAAQRIAVECMARDARVRCDGIWLDAAVSILEDRLASRRNDASDATVDVLHAQRAHVVTPAGWAVIDSGGQAADIAMHAAAKLGVRELR